MLIDHWAMTFLQGSQWYDLLRGVGRLAFPIYVFLLTEGFIHTRDRKKYGLRLLAFALISEVPWDLLHWGVVFSLKNQNVFFTLFFGFLGLCAIERYKSDRKKLTLSLIGLLAVTSFFHADYGSSGYGFILMMYLMRETELFRAVVGSCVLSSRWKAGLAFIPIGMYSGRRGYIGGPVLKYAFYAFYPAHMLILYYLKIR